MAAISTDLPSEAHSFIIIIFLIYVLTKPLSQTTSCVLTQAFSHKYVTGNKAIWSYGDKGLLLINF